MPHICRDEVVAIGNAACSSPSANLPVRRTWTRKFDSDGPRPRMPARPGRETCRYARWPGRQGENGVGGGETTHTARPEIPVLHPSVLVPDPRHPFKLLLQLRLQHARAARLAPLQQPSRAANVDAGAHRQDVGLVARALGREPIHGRRVRLHIRVRAGDNDDVELAGLDVGVGEVVGARDLDAGRELNELAALDGADDFGGGEEGVLASPVSVDAQLGWPMGELTINLDTWCWRWSNVSRGEIG